MIREAEEHGVSSNSQLGLIHRLLLSLWSVSSSGLLAIAWAGGGGGHQTPPICISSLSRDGEDSPAKESKSGGLKTLVLHLGVFCVQENL